MLLSLRLLRLVFEKAEAREAEASMEVEAVLAHLPAPAPHSLPFHPLGGGVLLTPPSWCQRRAGR